MKQKRTLSERYRPSVPCSCDICVAYCMRPGWWTVSEAAAALSAGLGPRMMLEMSPDLSFGVLAPSFKGCEGGFSMQKYWGRGCTFLSEGLCELFGSGYSPLECLFCHHERAGQGPLCHAALERDWRENGQDLVKKWVGLMGLWEPYALVSTYAFLESATR